MFFRFYPIFQVGKVVDPFFNPLKEKKNISWGLFSRDYFGKKSLSVKSKNNIMRI